MIYLTRHGQTDWNLERRWQGATDIPLNEEGISQALRLSELLRDVKFDRVISSPRARAIETAAIISGLDSSKVEICDELAETSLGEWEAALEEDIRSEMGDEYDVLRSHQGFIAPPGGETLFRVMERLYLPVEGWIEEACDREILIVAHQGTNAAVLMLITGRCSREDVAGFRQANGQVDVIDPVARSVTKTLKA